MATFAHQQRSRWYRRLKDFLRSGRSLCRTFALFSFFLTFSLGPAQGQEIPPPGPGAQPPPAGAPSEEAATPPTEFQPPPPSVQFPLLPPVELGPATPEAPLKPIPLGLAPPFQLEGKWFALRLSLGVQEEFTDNARQSNTNRQSEWSTRITPGISFGVDRPLAKLNLAYFPSFFFSNNNPENNNLNQFLTLQGSWQASPYVSLNFSDALTYSNEFLAFGDIGSLRTGTNPTLTNTASAGVAYTPTWGRLAVGYTNTINRTSDVQFPDDSLIQSGRISLDLTGPRLSAGASYTLTRGSYDISSDFWDHTVGINAAYPLTPTLNARFLGSFTYHNPDSPIAVEHLSGNVGIGGNWRYSPTGSLDLGAGISVFSPQANQPSSLTPFLVSSTTNEYRPSVILRWSQEFPYFVLSAQFSQLFVTDFGSTQFFNSSFTRTAGITLSTTGLLFRNLTGSLGVNWVQNEYPVTTINVRADTTQDTFNVDFGVRYYLFGGLSLNLGYVFTTRDSTNPTEDFYENRFRLGLTYQYNLL